jgi:predicted ATPase
MPPAIPLRREQRNLANVLLELRQARRDWADAIEATDADAEDRASEADQRTDDLRQEFADRFVAATGLTWKTIEEAIGDTTL